MTQVAIYTLVSPSVRSGVGRQLQGLLQSLQTLDATTHYLLYTDCQETLTQAVDAAHFERIRIPVNAARTIQNHSYQALRLPLDAYRRGADVVHVPNVMPLLFRRCPTVITIYDLTEFALPQRMYGRVRHYYRRLSAARAAQLADAIITTSHSTQSDIVRFLGVDAGRVHVIYPGVDRATFRPLELNRAARQGLQEKYGLPARFVLHVGKLQPRKNIRRLLEAFARIYDSGVALVLVGLQGWMYTEIFETIAALDLGDRVILPGFIADTDLPGLYNLATCLAFPSLYEGFGFPLVEAMACGTPVVTSDRSSLAEVAEGAAYLVDPLDVTDIARGLNACLSDTGLQEQLSARGLSRASHFSWRQCAVATQTLYEQVAAR